MLEVLKFVFSSFWIFLGTCFILGIISRILLIILALLLSLLKKD